MSTPWFSATGHPLFACVYAPEFPAQALLRLRPQLQGKRVAVLGGAPPHERVCAGDRQARRAGLRNGMTRVEAESFGEIYILRRSPIEEERARAAFMASAGSFAPLAEPCHTETAAMCVLDVSGLHRLHSGPYAFAGALCEALRARGLHASVAICGNFHAARALAIGVAGTTVAAPGEERGALAPLPLAVLGPTEEQAQTLALWGIRTLGGLAALPVRELMERMGQAGRQLHELALGECPHLFAPAPLAWKLREEIELEAPVRLLPSLLFVFAPMLDQLLAQARERMLALASVIVIFTLDARALNAQEDEQAPTRQQLYRRTIRPAMPTENKRLLLKLLQLDMEAHPPGAPVLAVALEATTASPGAVQAGLFAPPLPEPSRLDVTLARLRALVGEDRVGAPALRDTHAPDSFTMSSFQSELPPQAGEISPPTPALRQLRPPPLVTVRVEAGEPALFSFGGQHYQVHAACGPWRSSGEWWSTAWAHECWDVAASPTRPHHLPVRTYVPDLLSCRLRHDLHGKHWCVEGVYD